MILYRIATYLTGFAQEKEILIKIQQKDLNEFYVIASNEKEAVDMCICECERLGIKTEGRQSFFSVFTLASDAETPFAKKILVNTK